MVKKVDFQISCAHWTFLLTFVQTQKKHVSRQEARRQHRETAKAKTRIRPGFDISPDEVIANIVHHMDGPTSVCFALTSPRHYNIVQDVKKAHLKALYPAFDADHLLGTGMVVKADGERPPEKFIRLLWHRLGKSCVYCQVADKDALEWDGEKWTCVRHVCRGWLDASPYRVLNEPVLEKALLRFKMDIGLSKVQSELDGIRRSVESTTGRFETDEEMMQMIMSMDAVVMGMRKLGSFWADRHD